MLTKSIEKAKRNPTLLALGLIALFGVVLRWYFLSRYRPALLGYSDSANYILSAHRGIFDDPVRVSGYVLFLRFLHAISPHLVLVTITQHALGIAGGVLLFDSVRRTGAPPGLGLVPAAMVILGGSELMLEHAILTDSLFIFLVNLGLWCVVRTWTGSRWWAAGVGLSMGCATIVRTAGLELLPFMILCLWLAPTQLVTGGGHRLRQWRATTFAAGVAASLLVILPFLYAHKQDTGSWGFTSAGYLQLYGRVASWADCTKFTPPVGTAKLCVNTPVSQRLGPGVYQYSLQGPVYRAYQYRTPKEENGQLKAFALAAIRAQPLTYLEFVGRDLVRVVDPTFPSSPYTGIGNRAYGYTPDGNLSFYFDTSRLAGVERIVNSYYHSPGLLAGNVDILKSWDRDTRLEGPAMAIVLILALCAPLLASGITRRAAILYAVASAVLIVGPIVVFEYDWRYVVPAFGSLTAGAAIGAYEVWRRLRPWLPVIGTGKSGTRETHRDRALSLAASGDARSP